MTQQRIIPALERAWQAIRKQANVPLPMASDLTFTITGTGADEGATMSYEGRMVINVAADRLQMGGEAVLTTLLHHAVHLLALRRRIAVTTQSGYYHNQKFLDLATEFGLEHGSSRADPHRGFAHVVPIFPEVYKTSIAALDRAIALDARSDNVIPLPDRGRRIPANRAKATCACPAIIYVQPSTLDDRKITCSVCNEAFEVAT